MIAGEDVKTLLRAGHGDVEKALLVGEFGGAGIAENGENCGMRMLGVDDFALELEKDDDGGFEAFGFMNGETADLTIENRGGHDAFIN